MGWVRNASKQWNVILCRLGYLLQRCCFNPFLGLVITFTVTTFFFFFFYNCFLSRHTSHISLLGTMANFLVILMHLNFCFRRPSRRYNLILFCRSVPRIETRACMLNYSINSFSYSSSRRFVAETLLSWV